MDSLLLKKIIETQSIQDTLIRHTAQIQNLLEKNSSGDLWFKLLPFFGVIIGGVVTYVGQYLLKNKDLKMISNRDKIEIEKKILANIVMLHFYLMEWAYLEVDMKYQYHSSCHDKNDDSRKKALEEHYNDYGFINDYKSKVATALSEVLTDIPLHYKLNKKIISIENSTVLQSLFNRIINLKGIDEYPDDLEITSQRLRDDIQKIRDEYTKGVLDIRNMINLPKTKRFFYGRS